MIVGLFSTPNPAVLNQVRQQLIGKIEINWELHLNYESRVKYKWCRTKSKGQSAHNLHAMWFVWKCLTPATFCMVENVFDRCFSFLVDCNGAAPCILRGSPFRILEMELRWMDSASEWIYADGSLSLVGGLLSFAWDWELRYLPSKTSGWWGCGGKWSIGYLWTTVEGRWEVGRKCPCRGLGFWCLLLSAISGGI